MQFVCLVFFHYIYSLQGKTTSPFSPLEHGKLSKFWRLRKTPKQCKSFLNSSTHFFCFVISLLVLYIVFYLLHRLLCFTECLKILRTASSFIFIPYSVHHARLMKCQLRLFGDREDKLIIILGRKVHPISFPSHPTPRTESRFVINEMFVIGVY